MAPNYLFDPNGHVWHLQLAQYANNALSRSSMAVVRAHLIRCDECRDNARVCQDTVRQILRAAVD